jgi:hypothetical protein
VTTGRQLERMVVPGEVVYEADERTIDEDLSASWFERQLKSSRRPRGR